MSNFFAELAKWDNGVEDDEDKDLTMQAGTAFMLSFMGQQDKAEQVTDVLSTVMNYIKPFQKYVSPMGAMGTIADSLGGSIPAVGNFFDILQDYKDMMLSEVVKAYLNLLVDVGDLSGGSSLHKIRQNASVFLRAWSLLVIRGIFNSS
ncbi:MAG: hypothetical protein ACLFVB_09960 [Thermoplasmata archaeon]